jgi:putative FmdB family regulatory protein
MALYTYVCRTCGHAFELRRKFAERLDPSTCTECESDAHFALSLSAPSFVGAATAEMSCSSPMRPGGTCCGGGACGMN